MYPRWYRRSLLLESDNNFLIESRGTLHTFIIRTVESKHLGNYRCLASNSLGREAAEIQLTGETRQDLATLSHNSNWSQGYPELQCSRAQSWALWVTVTDWPGWLSPSPPSWNIGSSTGKLWYGFLVRLSFLRPITNVFLQCLKEKDNEVHLINAFILISDLIDFIFQNFPTDVPSCTDPTALIRPTNN